LCAPVPPGTDLPLGEGFYAAAVRECFEEAGVLLARRADAVGFDVSLRARLVRYRDDLNQGRIGLAALLRTEGLVADTDHMLHWSHWITPERFPRRFDTHFFLAPMPADQEPIFDPRETTAGAWVRPEDALDQFLSGDFPLVYATERQLEQLRGLSDARFALDRFGGRPVRANRPRIITLDGEERIVLDDGD
jgi:8-oxo-dGTP pyrophosphatase MutT (NUDIX family)